MAAALIIAAVILLVAGLRLRRMQEMRASHWLVLPTLLLAAAMPAYVAWKVLAPAHPGPEVAGVHVSKVSPVVDTTTLDLPPGYALLVTATLGEKTDDPSSDRTAYSLRVRGEGWEQAASGTIKRADAGQGPAIATGSGEGVTDAERRSSRLGEDLQDRFEFNGSGPIRIDVSNWSGEAASTLDLEVVEAPPPAALIWALIAVVSILGVVVEVRSGAEQFAGDVAFLAMWAIFLRDGVTPLDDWQEVVKAILPAALLGMLLVGGVAYLAVRYTTPPEAPPEPEGGKPAAADETPDEGRRRRRRRGGS